MELILQRGLPHQQKAVDAISAALNGVQITPPVQFYENPSISLSDPKLAANIREIQKNIPAEYRSSMPIGDCLNIDIKM
jgi:type III restriction enzyme